MATAGQQRRQGGSGKFVGLMVFLAGFIVAPGSAVIFAFGMIPTMVVSLIDPYRAKYRTRCVGALNFAGTMPFIFSLWGGGNSFDQALAMLGDPMTMLVMYGGAAIGWMMYSGLPNLVGGFIVSNSEQRIAELRKRQNDLVVEWGEEVKGNVTSAQ